MKALDRKTDAHQIDGYFDEYGRCTPNSLVAPVNESSRRYFLCEQPRIEYQSILENINQFLNNGERTISVDDFEGRCNDLINRLTSDPVTKNIGLGVHVPFVLPRGEYSDVGDALDTIFLPAVDKSFCREFPEYSFTNHYPQKLSGNVDIQNESRHSELIARNCESTLVGLYFPSLSEYSIPAAIEQLGSLPEEFLLAGGYDTCAALVACPSLLSRISGYPPLLWMSGIKGNREGFGYHFEAYGYNLTFNQRVHLGKHAEYWSSGLVVLG
jgi:hypothetical protein